MTKDFISNSVIHGFNNFCFGWHLEFGVVTNKQKMKAKFVQLYFKSHFWSLNLTSADCPNAKNVNEGPFLLFCVAGLNPDTSHIWKKWNCKETTKQSIFFSFFLTFLFFINGWQKPWLNPDWPNIREIIHKSGIRIVRSADEQWPLGISLRKWANAFFI